MPRQKVGLELGHIERQRKGHRNGIILRRVAHQGHQLDLDLRLRNPIGDQRSRSILNQRPDPLRHAREIDAVEGGA